MSCTLKTLLFYLFNDVKKIKTYPSVMGNTIFRQRPSPARNIARFYQIDKNVDELKKKK